MRVKISDLRAKVLNADQCAARALEGRDAAFAELEQFKRQLRRLPPVDSQLLVNLRRSVEVSQEEIAALRIQMRVLKHKHALYRLKNSQMAKMQPPNG